jgi:hypothetical protein
MFMWGMREAIRFYKKDRQPERYMQYDPKFFVKIHKRLDKKKKSIKMLQ